MNQKNQQDSTFGYPNNVGLTALSFYYQAGVQVWNYADVEQMVERLAVNLIETYGAQQVKEFQYEAIPHGGFIVLGLLSYYLSLPPTALVPQQQPKSMTVIVDDCSLTGARFAQYIATCQSKDLIFAHLASHPQLRKTIGATDSRVQAVIASYDLEDLADRFFDSEEEREKWRTKNLQRLDGNRYWVGMLQALAFPWSEPDRFFWNSNLEKFEANWFFVAPNQAIKTRMRLDLPLIPGIVKKKFRCPTVVAYQVVSSDQTILCNLEHKKIFQLQDVSSDIWRALTVYGNRDAVVTLILSRYDVNVEEFNTDLDRFIKNLRENCLIEYF